LLAPSQALSVAGTYIDRMNDRFIGGLFSK
jgi:hypothetical protein